MRALGWGFLIFNLVTVIHGMIAEDPTSIIMGCLGFGCIAALLENK